MLNLDHGLLFFEFIIILRDSQLLFKSLHSLPPCNANILPVVFSLTLGILLERVISSCVLTATYMLMTASYILITLKTVSLGQTSLLSSKLSLPLHVVTWIFHRQLKQDYVQNYTHSFPQTPLSSISYLGEFYFLSITILNYYTSYPLFALDLKIDYLRPFALGYFSCYSFSRH